MPWNKDINGDPKYDLSVYAKEELPTWSEVYNEFYKQKMFSYSITDPSQQTIDPYWKIPHMKYIIMTVCNQFNKMIFEDGYKDEIIKKYISNEKCRILPRRVTGNCAEHQRYIANEVKKARFMALIPFVK